MHFQLFIEMWDLSQTLNFIFVMLLSLDLTTSSAFSNTLAA